ncbi:hypothetical protein GCM10010922_07940 [Microbacterium sorbitolivorans]|uniref:efflux RND transporter periplasmic adaptor subunit n=1 Tax=Microbacterium sorbitolivorans TaxID=1867410 RepID=UPI0013B05326|nr:efflux RND transporter periplasmic adaptor subunit [Microbacterium sorbitolivorans]GGF35132.1 hypothetical protein GCM10010922_07940 [Microbacterium sorbitolivorans]
MALRRKKNDNADAAETEGTEAESAFDAIVGDDSDAAPEKGASKGSGGWGRVVRGNRGLWITALVAVVALGGGIALGHYVVSPFDKAAGEEAPEPGLVTVPVEFGALSNDVTIRGDVGYDDAVELKIDTSSFEGAAIVTGQVPERGAELGPLSVALEVTGRPVIVLPGELPAYRTLRIGASGPDVTQLKESLAAVGIDPGDVGSDVFDQATANAVGALYSQAGYTSPAAEDGSAEAVVSAEAGVRDAQQQIADAQKALAEAQKGPTEIEIREADGAVDSLWRQVKDAERAGEDASDLRNQMEIAKLQRAALDVGADTSAEQSMVAAANEGLTAAQEQLAKAQEAVQPYLPSSEVLFMNELPRRVDEVAVSRGDTVEGAAMTVSGATVQLTASAGATEAELLEEGMAATFAMPSGGDHGATITSIGKNDGGRVSVVLEPDELTAEQLDELRGENVRVNIAVGATDGDVLSVPYAALTAGPGGESRVEVVEGDPRDGDAAKTRIVTVETGLASGGYVEVTPTEGELAEGDLVVVGS